MLEQIKADRITAMKNKDKAKRTTLQLLLAKLEKEQIALQTELTKEQIEVVINRSLKELDKEIESYKAVSRETTSQEAEKKLLLSYLPKQLTENEIRAEVKLANKLVEDGVTKNAMQYLSNKLQGKANMGLVSKIVKEMK
jgi:uncharacterized protein YqeY